MKKICLLALFLSVCSLFVSDIFAQPEVPERNPTYTIVQEMPRFPGCEDQGLDKASLKKCAETEMLKFIYQNVTYPEDARLNEVEGMVVVSFVVNKDGSIVDPVVVRDIGHGCGEEVLRIVDTMPNWIPGKQDGQAVNVKFNLPVRFKMEDDPVSEFDNALAQLAETPVYEGLSSVMCDDFAGEFFNATDLNAWADGAYDQTNLCGYNSSVKKLEVTYVEDGSERSLESEGELTEGMRDYFRNAKPGSVIRMIMKIEAGGMQGSIIKVLIVE